MPANIVQCPPPGSEGIWEKDSGWFGGGGGGGGQTVSIFLSSIPSSSSIITIVLEGLRSMSGSLVVRFTKKSSRSSYFKSLTIVVSKHLRIVLESKMRLTGEGIKSSTSV